MSNMLKSDFINFSVSSANCSSVGNFPFVFVTIALCASEYWNISFLLRAFFLLSFGLVFLDLPEKINTVKL